MALGDHVMETTTTTGTADFTLAGAVTGYVTFNNGIGQNVNFEYAADAVDANDVPTGEWEQGVGYLSGGSTLVRSVVLKSSNANAKVSFSAGTKRVYCALPASEYQTAGTSYARLVGADMP